MHLGHWTKNPSNASGSIMWQSKKARQVRPFNPGYPSPQLNIPISPVDPTWDKIRLKGYDILKGAGYVPLVLFSRVSRLLGA
jgi:hypothetical protein